MVHGEYILMNYFSIHFAGSICTNSGPCLPIPVLGLSERQASSVGTGSVRHFPPVSVLKLLQPIVHQEKTGRAEVKRSSFGGQYG